MRTKMHRTLFGGFIAATLLVASVMPAAAQNRINRRARNTQTVAGDQRIETISRMLDLNDRQRASIARTLRKAQRDGQATAMWAVAATLQKELTREQKTRLLATGRRAAAFTRGASTRQVRQNAPNRLRAARGNSNLRPADRNRRFDRARTGVRRFDGWNAAGTRMARALGLNRDQVELFQIHTALTSMKRGRAEANRMNRPARRSAVGR